VLWRRPVSGVRSLNTLPSRLLFNLITLGWVGELHCLDVNSPTLSLEVYITYFNPQFCSWDPATISREIRIRYWFVKEHCGASAPFIFRLKRWFFQIDRNYPSHVILISVPLGRVQTSSPAMGLSPQQLSAAVAGGFSFLFGNPFICGTLLAGKVTSLWRGAILPHRPHWPLDRLSVGAFFYWHRVCRSEPMWWVWCSPNTIPQMVPPSVYEGCSMGVFFSTPSCCPSYLNFLWQVALFFQFM
jgi:hypothetical protein